MARIDHRGTPCPEIFGGNARGTHPYYEPHGKRYSFSPMEQKANLFEYLRSEKAKKAARNAKGYTGRILPNLAEPIAITPKPFESPGSKNP